MGKWVFFILSGTVIALIHYWIIGEVFGAAFFVLGYFGFMIFSEGLGAYRKWSRDRELRIQEAEDAQNRLRRGDGEVGQRTP